MSVIRSVYDRTRALQTAVKDVARFREIASVLVYHGFGEVIERLRLRGPLKVSTDGGTPLTQSNFNRRVKSALEALGPTFIKFGQIMSTRPDLIPAALVGELATLQDNVAPLPIAEVRAQIERELGAAPEVLFSDFTDVPLASASIAQVHRATLKSGERVVVKVQRPNIRRKIESDLNILYFLARQLESVFPEARLFNLLGIISEFEQNINRETNFSIEVANIQRFQRNFQGSTAVYIPTVHKAFSTTQVLTLEYIDGPKITQALEAPGLERLPLAKRFLDAAFQMLYVDGFFHGDAHPGNVFMLKDGRIALIDFGMVGRLSQQMRERVVDIVFAILREDLASVARVFYELGRPEGPVDYGQFEAEVIETLEQEVVGKPLSEIQIGSLFMKICEGAIKYRIRMPSDFTMMFKAMVTAEGLAKMIAPDINVMEEARPHIMKMVAERYSMKRIGQEVFGDVRRLARFARGVPTAGTEILRQVQEGELKIGISVDHLRPLMQRHIKAQNRNQLALVFAALCVSGTMALSENRVTYNGLPVLSMVLYGLALASGSLFFLSFLRSRF